MSVDLTPHPNLVKDSSKEGFVLGYGDYLRFSKLLLERCGLYFSESRRSELEYRLRMAFAASTCADLDEFYRLLQEGPSGSVEMDILVNSVTISETHFFRDTAQFNALYTHVIPRLIERKRSMRTMRIWSAGCASGEEPYSIAIMLKELIPDIENWSITILGTDINTASLERARTGLYGNWAFREDRANEMRPRYFQQVNNRFELSPEVRRMIQFNRLNLVEPCYPSYETNTMSMDLIMCRNVTIYFSEAVTRWVVDRFYDSLVDGGWLVVGHSEPSIDIYRRFRVRNFTDATLYQRMPETSSLRWPQTQPFTPPPILIPPLPPVEVLSINPMPTPTSRPVPPSDDSILPFTPPVAGQPQVSPIETARELLEFGRSTDALKLLLKLEKDAPGNGAVLALLGQTYADLGNHADAEKYCRKAMVSNKLCIDAYYTLSLVYQHSAKLSQAIEMMKKVVYIDRGSILGHYGLANLYHDSGLLSQAQKSLDNALRLLSGLSDDGGITGSRGITVGRLREAVIHQQQTWSQEAG